MRGKTLSLLAMSLSVVVAIGCSDDKKRYYTNSGSTTGGVTSGNGGVNSGSVPVTTANSPNSQLMSEALLGSFVTDEVIEVDAKNGTINNRWSVGKGPVDVLNYGLYAYAASALDQNLTVIDRLANNTVATVDLANGPISGIPLIGNTIDSLLKPLIRPTGVAVSQNGNKIYSANLLNLSVINGTTYQVEKSHLGLSSISLQNILSNPGQALSQFIQSPVQGLGFAKVAATDTHAVATCMLTGNIVRIDGATNAVIDYVDVGRAPIGVSIVQNKAYVACALSQEIWVVDVATGNVLTTITGQGMLPFDVAGNKQGDRVYVANAMSGDVSVIDPAVDLIIDTLPGGTSINSLFQQAGLTIPTSSSQGGGFNALLNNFLQGYTAGSANPSSFGGLLAGAFGGGSGSGSGSGGGLSSLLSPGALINGVITAFLGSMGLSQQQLGALGMPGTLSVGVAENPDLVITSNGFTGDLSVTDSPTKVMVSYAQLAGAGPSDIAPIWPR